MKSIIMWLIAAATITCAQSLVGSVRGRSPEGSTSPIPGAQLRWKGTTLGALTRSDGSFVIDRPPAGRDWDTLIISAVGYRSDTVAVARTLHHLDHVLENQYNAAPVEVVGDASSIAAAEPIRTELVTRRQLEQSACCTLAESFERSSSVEVQFSDAVLGAKTIRLLGLRGIYTSGLIEAVPLLRGVTSAYALDDVPGPFLDGISISKGAASVLNGYDGITGQINIEFKKPQRDVPLFANAFANHLGRAELNLTSAQAPSDNFHTMVMLHGRTFQRQLDANGDGFIDMPLFTNLNAVGRFLWQGDDTEAQLLVRPTRGTYRSGTVGAWTNGSDGYRIETITERVDISSKIATNDLSSPLADRIGIQLAASLQRLATNAGTRTIAARQLFGWAKLVAVLEPSDAVTLLYGISFQFDAPRQQLDSLALNRTERVPGIFAELTWKPSHMLMATVGARYDWHNLFGSQLTPRLHIKYNPTELVTLRASIGTGMRVPYTIADNAAALLNNRRVLLDTTLLPERALNFGGGVTATLLVGSHALTLDGEFYHTRFSRQLVTDFDRSARVLAITYAQEGYANSSLVQLSTTVVAGLELTLAYRLMDTYMQTGGKLQLQPLVSPHRVLLALSYLTPDRVWEINPTLVWYSSGRIPTTSDNPPSYQFGTRFPSYLRAAVQVNWRPTGSAWEFYVGVENIANVLQPVAVLAADAPHSPYFDASLVWGPLDQRTAYVGVRLRVGEPFE
jgi:outer membrane receptor protein involved in Fe transport